MNSLYERFAAHVYGDSLALPVDVLESMYEADAAVGAPETAHEYGIATAKDHLLTPANAMTFTRPILGAMAARRLMRGNADEKIMPLVVTMALTDAEGKVARATDAWSVSKTGSKNGYGTTELGKSGDPIADTIGFLEVAAGALKAPRVSRLGKLAVGIVLTTEGVKSGWAVKAGIRHKKQTGEKLALDVTKTGKTASGAKFMALTLAAATHDLEPGLKRTLAGLGAVGSALMGAYHGEKARSGYKRELMQKGITTGHRPKISRRIP